MKLGGTNYRTMMSQLDDIGVYTQIFRVSNSCYQFVVNYELKGQSRQRSTCNKWLVKLHKVSFKPSVPACRRCTIKVIKFKRARKK